MEFSSLHSLSVYTQSRLNNIVKPNNSQVMRVYFLIISNNCMYSVIQYLYSFTKGLHLTGFLLVLKTLKQQATPTTIGIFTNKTRRK